MTTGSCRFHVTYQHRRDDDPRDTTEDQEHPGHLRYRAHCACGHISSYYSRERQAAEYGADHAHPGWRTLPVLEPRPDEGARAQARWEVAARRAYPHGWFERGGPVITYRGPGLTCHVPGGAPGGGYDMARARPGRPTAPPQPRPQADTLF